MSTNTCKNNCEQCWESLLSTWTNWNFLFFNVFLQAIFYFSRLSSQPTVLQVVIIWSVLKFERMCQISSLYPVLNLYLTRVTSAQWSRSVNEMSCLSSRKHPFETQSMMYRVVSWNPAGKVCTKRSGFSHLIIAGINCGGWAYSSTAAAVCHCFCLYSHLRNACSGATLWWPVLPDWGFFR